MAKLKTLHMKYTGAIRLILTLLLLIISSFSLAELQELEDEKMDELRGREGVTIDLAFKLSIGEIAFDFSQREYEEGARPKAVTPPPPRIEYHQNGK